MGGVVGLVILLALLIGLLTLETTPPDDAAPAAVAAVEAPAPEPIAAALPSPVVETPAEPAAAAEVEAAPEVIAEASEEPPAPEPLALRDFPILSLARAGAMPHLCQRCRWRWPPAVLASSLCSGNCRPQLGQPPELAEELEHLEQHR